MIRTLRWIWLAIAFLAVGCREELTAPGACPEFCPPESVQLVDSLLLRGIATDSSFAGYVPAHDAGGIQLVSDPTASTAVSTSRGIARFFAFSERVLLNPGDTTTAAVTSIDSFTVRVSVARRLPAAVPLELVLYRLPASVDSSVAFADLDAFFMDSARVGSIMIPDSLVAGFVSGVLAGSAFPTFDADGRRAAIGIALTTVDPAYVIIGTLEGGASPQLSRFGRVDSSGVSVPRSDGRQAELDTYVGPPVPVLAPNQLQVGGLPAARTMIRFAFPPLVIDSSEVVRATLLLVPAVPAIGAPGDSMTVLAQSVAADVGAKSPLLVVGIDSVAFRSTRLAVGFSDTVRIDITDAVRRWQREPTRPRMLVLRTVPEGSSFGEVRFFSTAAATGHPRLRVTYVPPFRFGGQP